MKLFSVFIAGLLGMQFLLAQETPAESEPPQINYSDLRLTLDDLVGKTVRIKGTYYCSLRDATGFMLRVGDNTVPITWENLPKETLESVRELRDFSDIPLTIAGVVMRQPLERTKGQIFALRIDIQDETTLHSFNSRRGIVTVPEIENEPFHFLHSTVTMQGRFDFRDPSRDFFRMWRGISTVAVDYSKLPADNRKEILSIPNFSNRALKVSGVLRPSPFPEISYIIEATSVQFEPVIDEAQLAAAEAQKKTKDITYSDILRKPQKYVNKNVELKGGFEVCRQLTREFEIWQDGDSIVISYDKLPPEQQVIPEQQKPFNSVLLYIKGKLVPYENNPRRYHVIASDVSYVK